MVEVGLKVEAEQLCHADGHVGIAAEIEVELERIEDRAEPCGAAGKRTGRKRGNALECGAEIVGQQDLFRKAEDKHRDGVGDLVQRHRVLLQLRRDVRILDDRPGDHFGEEADIQAEIQRIFLRGCAAVINVRKVGQIREGEEGNAERKRRRRRVQRERQKGVERFDGKGGVFIEAEKQQIEKYAKNENKFGPALR